MPTSAATPPTKSDHIISRSRHTARGGRRTASVDPEDLPDHDPDDRWNDEDYPRVDPGENGW
jgi:hypothetical protein